MRLPVADARQTVRYARKLIWLNRRSLTLMTVLMMAGALCAIAIPYLLGILIDAVKAGTAGQILTRTGLTILALTLANTALQFGGDVIGGRMGERIFAQLREGVVDRVMGMPLSVVEEAGTGDLIGRTVTDVNNLSWTVRKGVPEILMAIGTLIVTLVASFLVSWQLAIAVPLGALPVIAIMFWYQPRATPTYRATSQSYADQNGVVTETLENAATVEALSLARRRVKRLEAVAMEAATLERYSAALRVALISTFAFALVAPPILVMILGAIFVPRGVVTIGQVTTVVLYAWSIARPIQTLQFWYDMLQESYASLARITGVALVSPDREVGDARPRDKNLEVVDARYAYRAGHDVLHGIDLRVRPGERLAIVGPSGSGKTTLARLIAGIHAPTAGHVQVGGVDMVALPEVELHRQVALINQEHHVFLGTVAENLRYGRADASDSELWAALEAVEAAQWVRELDDGLETAVGSSGVALSDSQAQQLALARVILLDPHTLILDEATSLLDPTAARSLERALGRLLEGRTVIAIAHRLYTAHDADRIAVMVDGRIVELGSHDELVARGGEYASLWAAWAA